MKLNSNNRIVYLKDQEVLTDCFKVWTEPYKINVEFKFHHNEAYWGSTIFSLYNITAHDIAKMEEAIKGKYKFAKKRDILLYISLIEDYNTIQREVICNLDLHYSKFKSAKERDFKTDEYWKKELYLSIGSMNNIIESLKYFRYGNMELSKGINYINGLIINSI